MARRGHRLHPAPIPVSVGIHVCIVMAIRRLQVGFPMHPFGLRRQFRYGRKVDPLSIFQGNARQGGIFRRHIYAVAGKTYIQVYITDKNARTGGIGIDKSMDRNLRIDLCEKVEGDKAHTPDQTSTKRGSHVGTTPNYDTQQLNLLNIFHLFNKSKGNIRVDTASDRPECRRAKQTPKPATARRPAFCGVETVL